MRSKIITGGVMHERLETKGHRFEYPVYFYALDLQELETLGKKIWGFGYNQFAPIAIHDKDYLQRGAGGIRQKLDRFLESKGLEFEIARVLLITSARFFNHVFNPINLYYCYSGEDELKVIVMEVSNTFNERHLYILDEPLEDSSDRVFHARAKKEFHVSPFFDRSGEYDCRFSLAQDNMDIHINLIKEGKPAIVSRWYGKPIEMTSANIAKVLLRFPLTAVMTLPRIHWQAVKLYFVKKIKHHKKPIPESPMTIRSEPPKLKHRIAMKIILPILKRIQVGKLVMLLPDGHAHTFGNPEATEQATLKVNHYDFFWRTLKAAGIGMGEAYMARDWESPDPVAVLNTLILNKKYLEKKEKPLGAISGAWNRFKHVLKKNSIFHSRKNIREHYDLSNDFFKLFLDPNMMYSCAFFSEPGESLEKAQQNKVERIIDKARIGKDDHVLEIGCGWGGFAIEAVKRTGCRVTGITLSEEQLALAKGRVKQAGLENNIELYLCDYRKLRGQFDRIVSIEMLEAVGHEYLDAYFQACDRLLKPEGVGVYQVITMPDQRYEEYRHGCDFIQKHIFPGGHLPSLTALCESMTRASDFMIEDVENIGDHYGETLKIWRERFLENREKVAALGFDNVFMRKWEYYLIYCESAYRMRYINNLQFVTTRVGNRSLSLNKEKVNEQSASRY